LNHDKLGLLVIKGNFKALALLIGLVGIASIVRADSLDKKVIALFPSHVSEFGYANLAEAREQPWFGQFQQQALPSTVIAFEQFVASVGIQPNSQVEEVAWALTSNATRSPSAEGTERAGGETVGVLLGEFDIDAARSTLEARKVATVDLDSYTLYRCGIGPECGNIFFVMLDSNTMAFGQLGALTQLIQVKSGSQESLLANEAMARQIEQVNGDGTFWDVFDAGGAIRIMQKAAPGAWKFTQSREVFRNVKWLAIRAESSNATEVHLEITCASPSDSLFLSQILQAGLLLRKYEAAGNEPILQETLDGVSVAAQQNQVDVLIQLSNEQLIGLVEEGAFSSPIIAGSQ